MFSKKYRLPREVIDEIFKNKTKTSSTRSFLIKKQENTLEYSRFAVIISKKIEKLAVGRHFSKRKVIKILKELAKESRADFVVIVRNNLKDKTLEDLKKELGEFIK